MYMSLAFASRLGEANAATELNDRGAVLMYYFYFHFNNLRVHKFTNYQGLLPASWSDFCLCQVNL